MSVKLAIILGFIFLPSFHTYSVDTYSLAKIPSSPFKKPNKNAIKINAPKETKEQKTKDLAHHEHNANFVKPPVSNSQPKTKVEEMEGAIRRAYKDLADYPSRVNLIRQPAQSYTLYNLPSVVPISKCDKRYAMEMERALNQLYRENGNPARRIDLTKSFEEYMIMIKQERDIDNKIRIIERDHFNLNTVRLLRVPLKNYINCKDFNDVGFQEHGGYGRNFEVNSVVPTVTRLGYTSISPVGFCDHRYATNMAQALDDYTSIATVDLRTIAEEYMILIKQQRDLDRDIRKMESKLFNITLIALGRHALQEYERCLLATRTGTYSVNFMR